MGETAKLFRWEHEPGVADLTERQQELYQDLAHLIENASHTSILDSEESVPLEKSTQKLPALHEKSALPAHLASELSRLNELQTRTETLREHLSAADGFLTDLSGTLVKVKSKTDALYGDCEDLVNKQHQLTIAADLLHTKMEPLLEFDRLAVQLNAPGVTVTSDAFLSLLDRLQINMAHLEANPGFKEVSLFKTRYSQLFSKAAALIRNEVNRNFQSALAQVAAAPATTASPHDENALNTLSNFYSVFQQASASLRTLLRDLDQRGVQYQVFYGDLIQDCHRMYFSARGQLLNPFIGAAVGDFRRNARQNISELFRIVCSFLVRICREEYRLYYQYFSQPSPALSEFLGGVCQQFYDGIRPEIIHLDQVEKISDVCCFLSQEVLREHGSTDLAAELVPFVEFVQVLLADSRERLMFRVTTFIQQEIIAYTPSRGDLAYPEKLEILQQLIHQSKEEARNRMSSRMSVSSISSRAFEERYLFSVESQGFWYPTLRRAVGFLGKLMNSLDSQSFKIVAQDVIFQTLDSLTRASVDLLKLKGQLHADLFLISHVLVLREHLTLYQMDLSTEETSLDFSRVVGAAKGIVSRSATMLSLTSRNALLDFFLSSSPDVKVSTVDCRKEVDARLRGVCLRLVDHVCGKILGPLPEFVDKAEIVLSMEKPSSPIRLNNQAFATPQEVKELVAVVYRAVKNDLPATLTQFLLYLISMDTQYVLYKPVRANISRCLERMNKVILDGYPEEEDRAVIGWPSLEQWNAMLNVTPQPVIATQAKSAAGKSDVQHV
ncbi:Conserved oligomeric Golgi complex subunit 3 [Hypsibius exemplaris]|uniref:Conserved oligomeric Golgi complex subunit 3 n=1 Tax=Hypsibius exemplaris TaxID=2072580 RepID=A0A1W0WC94_HYPEX|nr:Conserved oligomeric Golgi complex subunit 3 [Hypsibius exemplaris]